MHLPEDYNEKETSLTPTMIMTIGAVTLFVGIILGVVVFLNSDSNGRNNANYAGNSVVASTAESAVTEGIGNSNLTPGDLNFWDMYPEKTAEPTATPKPAEDKETDPSKDGKHTLITYADGSEEWVLISPNLPKHIYDFTKLVCQSNLMKYYENGKKISYVGVDISQEQDYVEFSKVKKAGIDFVMLRAGVRGYSSGLLGLDEYFLDNLKRATSAGLDVGVYFSSQAITVEEAREEAEMVIQNLKEYDVNYPIAFCMEKIDYDIARTDALTRSEKTEIALTFLQEVETAGYKSILYGNKEWLLKEIDMSKLTSFDVWLSQTQDIPDYPYNFAMWQYDYEGSVDGIVGDVNLNISFIKYTEK